MKLANDTAGFYVGCIAGFGSEFCLCFAGSDVQHASRAVGVHLLQQMTLLLLARYPEIEQCLNFQVKHSMKSLLTAINFAVQYGLWACNSM